MPTLLDLAGIDRPRSRTGRSLLTDPPRKTLCCEALEGQSAMRMMTDGGWKLVWHPAGNRFLMGDRSADPDETRDFSRDPAHAAELERLSSVLAGALYGTDRVRAKWSARRDTARDAPNAGPRVNLWQATEFTRVYVLIFR